MSFLHRANDPTPNGGLCEHCGHENGLTFGSFHCANCGKLVEADPMNRKFQEAYGHNILRGLLGGLTLVVLLVVLIALSEPSVMEKLKGYFSS